MSPPPAGAATRVRPSRLRVVVLLLAALVVLPACSSGPGGVVDWNGMTVDLPDEWRELERRDTLLFVADGPPIEEAGERGGLEVATQFTIEPGTSIQDWRAFVTEEGGEVEDDRDIDFGGVPGRLLQFSLVTNQVPTRERVIVVPSRDLVILQQPVPIQGQTDAPEVYLERIDEFDAILDSLRFGAPPDYLDE